MQDNDPLQEITFEGKDLSGINATEGVSTIPASVMVYIQPGTSNPGWLREGKVPEVGEEKTEYKLSVSGAKDGRLDLGAVTIANGSLGWHPWLLLENQGSKTLNDLKIQSSAKYSHISDPKTTLAPDDFNRIEFYPNSDLKTGSYTETFTITADGLSPITVNVNFTVTAIQCLSQNPAALDFGTVYVGGDLPKAQTVTITAGDHAVDLKLGSEPEHFTCTIGQTQLAQGRSTTVTIQPKADLKAGTYKERVRLTCGEHRGSVVVELQFVVKNTPSFKLSLTEMDFGTAKQGYTPEAQTLTVTNITGSSALLKKTTLSSSDFEFTLKLYEGGYSMSDGHTDDIAAVRPKAGLKAGTYTGTLTLEAEAGVTYTIPLKFVVVSRESALTAVPATLNFAAVAEGDYTPPATQTVTITNTGRDTVTLQAPAAMNGDAYILGTLSRTTLAAGQTATFTIQPKAGLKEGVYTEHVIIKSDQNDSAAVGINFSVQEKLAAFADASRSDWFYNDVEYAYEKGLMKGAGDNRFDPYGTTTWGQIVTILYRLEGEPTVSGRSSFTDVSSGQYYANAVKWASDHNIVNGYSSTSFGPDDLITREQMAAILYRYAGYKHYDVTARADLSKFSDAGSVSSYALDTISWANSQGIINGVTDSTIEPWGNATRAQAAAILHHFCENIIR